MTTFRPARLLNGLLLAAGLLTSIMALPQKGVVVTLLDGSVHPFQVQASGRLDVDASNLLLRTEAAAPVVTIALSTVRKVTFSNNVVQLRPRLWLEGPFNSTTNLMNDSLRRRGVLPIVEPYSALGLASVVRWGERTTTTILARTGNTAVVDWVRVELRSAAAPATVVATCHALLQCNGEVVSAADGYSALAFQAPAGSYHVVVRHRNHLGAMTAASVALTSTAATVDFRTASLTTYGTDARKIIGTQTVLRAGNTVIDTPRSALRYTGNTNDRDPILVKVGGSVPTTTTSGYHTEDVNMDGTVKYTGTNNDRDPILVNLGGSIPTTTLQEQLP